MRELKIDQKWIDGWGSVAGAVNKNPTDPGHLSPHAGPPGWEKERGEKHSWKEREKFKKHISWFIWMSFVVKFSTLPVHVLRMSTHGNRNIRQCPKIWTFMVIGIPTENHRDKHCLKWKKKVEESCSCWIDFLLSPAYFPDSGKAGARGVWWVCGGGGGLNGNRMTLYSPTVAVDLCLQLTCASPIIYLASLCFVMFTCSSDIVKLAVIVFALAYMSTR